MRKLLFVFVALVAAYVVSGRQHGAPVYPGPPSSVSRAAGDSATAIAKAFANHESHVQVAGEGVVIKVLPDDNRGNRHQRFIIRLASGQTLLVAHNIDLAPRINALRVGDTVRFNGEYEWNDKGGVLHWTHRDPHGNHVDGWLRYKGQTYQ